jgi:hypothetical protein
MPDRLYPRTWHSATVHLGNAMDGKTQELLHAFVQMADRSKLLPEDWQRFFHLTIHVHQHDVLMTGQYVRLHLMEKGFTADSSSRLGWVFELFCQLLNRYDEERTVHR